ncbi:MAG: CoA pyrophosphatase [Deltaproteobacteria bacterium]|nr:CoA pyrophosphatase [Deltaproteobacteria bacterium]
MSNISAQIQNDLSVFEKRLLSARRRLPKKKLPEDGLITAAVLVPIFQKNSDLHVLLTKRSDMVEHHRGEISFPGGKVDPTDPDLKSCALRETLEEVGISPVDVKVVAELDDFYTVATRFHVVPFVGIIPHPYKYRISQREIAGIVDPPLDIFFDPNMRHEDTLIFHGEPVQVTSYLWEGHNIWGATARILKHLVELIESDED